MFPQSTPRRRDAASARNESPVELSPFIVTTDKGICYLATNTMSGNRSDNYTPPSGLDINGNNIGNVRGEGFDYGVKFRVGENRLSDRVLGYLPDSEPVRGPKWVQVDANLAYRRALWNRRVEMRVQLNVQNLLDNRDLIWTTIDPATFEKNDYSLFSPRQFILSASFSYR